MSWLKGSTTWANCVDDLTKLACGEIADGVGTTVPTGDRWVRPISGQNLIRSHASKDVALGDMANRLGYFALTTYLSTASTPNSQAAQASVCKLTNIFTSNPATTAGRWVLQVAVQTVNTVSGNYSTALFQIQVFDADTGTQINSFTNLSPNAAGAYTNGTYGFQLSLTDPSGFLAASTRWYRLFTTTYVGGIDWWGPFYCRRSGDATFSTNPPAGVSGTDWDANVDVIVGADSFAGGFHFHRGGIGEGLGIKTNTALTGGRYVYTYSAALIGLRLVAASGASNGQINLEIGCGGKVDTVYQNPTYRQHGGAQRQPWLRAYQTPGSVTNGSSIQYWMCVKADRLVIVLNADPAQTGKSTCAWVGTINASHATYDKFPVVFSTSPADYTADNTNENSQARTQFTLWQLFKRQDGSEGGRDWQTFWSRCDMSYPIGTDTYGEWAPTAGQAGYLAVAAIPFGYYSQTGATAATILAVPPRSPKPQLLDNKWYLYAFHWADRDAFTNQVAFQDRLPRGPAAGVFFLPGDGWASGDELTDTATSDKYFLVAADYHGIGPRMRTTTNTFFGGVAILEE